MRQQRGQPRPPNLRPDPAPGNLRLVQNFVNTLDAEEGLDDLATPQAMSAWLSGQGLAQPGTAVDKADWQSAVAVRQGLRALLRAHNRVPLDAKAMDRLNRSLAKTLHRVRFAPDGSAHLEPAEPGWPTALTRILDAVFEAMADGRWERFKACANAHCQWAFFDASRNRMGKWCTVRRCGHRLNSRTYQRRQPKHEWKISRTP